MFGEAISLKSLRKQIKTNKLPLIFLKLTIYWAPNLKHIAELQNCWDFQSNQACVFLYLFNQQQILPKTAFIMHNCSSLMVIDFILLGVIEQ